MQSMQEFPMGTQTMCGPTGAKKARCTGSALIEVIIAAAILILALMGYSSSFVSGRKQVLNQQRYQMAVHLTSQKVEEIRAKGYVAAAVGEQEEEISLDGLAGVRAAQIELTAEPSAIVPQPLKKVTVTTAWVGTAQDYHEIELVTYIGP